MKTTIAVVLYMSLKLIFDSYNHMILLYYLSFQVFLSLWRVDSAKTPFDRTSSLISPTVIISLFSEENLNI
jgi:hypothetical protein